MNDTESFGKIRCGNGGSPSANTRQEEFLTTDSTDGHCSCAFELRRACALPPGGMGYMYELPED